MVDLNSAEEMAKAAEKTKYLVENREFLLDVGDISRSVPLEGLLLNTGVKFQQDLLETVEGRRVSVSKGTRKLFEEDFKDQKKTERIQSIVQSAIKKATNVTSREHAKSIVLAYSDKVKEVEMKRIDGPEGTLVVRIPRW